jgi:hypothetical protein
MSYSTAKTSTEIEVSLLCIPQEESVDEKLIDYEFAINERQNKMFEASSLSGLSPSKTGSKEIESKLSEIEK